MTIAIMQPYLFPYVGYFQLIDSVDTFVVYDDVNFIKKGYINRNNILYEGRAKLFTAPVLNTSQNRTINEHWYAEDNSVLNLIEMAYRKAPYFDQVSSLLTQVFSSKDKNVAVRNALGLRLVMEYLGLRKKFVFSSEFKVPDVMAGQERILDICKKMDAATYINPPGGKALYSAEAFGEINVRLRFLNPKITEYDQKLRPFVPNLSIVDVLMFNSPEAVKSLLTGYSFE